MHVQYSLGDLCRCCSYLISGLIWSTGGDGCARFLQQNFYRNLAREISHRRLQHQQHQHDIITAVTNQDMEMDGAASVTDLAAASALPVPVTAELMHDAFTSAYLMSNLQLKFTKGGATGSTTSMASGATAVTAVITKGPQSGGGGGSSRWLHLANVGDSAALLCVANPRSKDIDMQWETQRLHQTHRPSTPSERCRVMSTGGFILRGRLNGTLAVTRAFGNHGHVSSVGSVSSAAAGEGESNQSKQGRTETGAPAIPAAATATAAEPEPESSHIGTPSRGRLFSPSPSSMEGLSVLPATRSVELDENALFLVL
eukprot:COSAG06_NODE_12836_length_1322_cov_4.421096_2_plen_313_part_01